MIRKRLSAMLVFSLTLLLNRPPMGTAYVTVGYSPQKTDFSVSFRDESSSYKSTPILALPGEPVALKVSSDAAATFSVTELVALSDLKKVGVINGRQLSGQPALWNFMAPKKTGTYIATIRNNASGATMNMNVLVMVPFDKNKDGVLNGFKIGQYPHISAARGNLYTLPRGFIEVTAENKDLLLTPHFKLSQFLCKQGVGVFPQYVVLRERLLFKLEYVLEHVNNDGIPAKTFSVMSGYRTPYYNHALGNVKYSRHMWGDAADIYINDDPNVVGMGDLNADGKCDIKDAELLCGIVNELSAEPGFKKFIGGLGRYKPTSAHGPFVHVDTRGANANWSSN